MCVADLEDFQMPDRNDRADAETRILSVIREAINLNAMEETERAVQLLTPMLSEFPEEPAVHLYLAWYLRGCDRFEEAIEHARRVVQLLPRSSRASLVLFHNLWKAGYKNDAIEEIRRFVPIRSTERHTANYVDILKKWEAGDFGEGRYTSLAADSVKRLLQ
jgi:predicted Zn-dependent protease